MKPLQVNEDIIPIGEFKTHAARVIRKLHQTKRPIVLTQHGKPTAVIISPDEFDRWNEYSQFVSAVQQGIENATEGKLIADHDMTSELDERFGELKD